MTCINSRRAKRLVAGAINRKLHGDCIHVYEFPVDIHQAFATHLAYSGVMAGLVTARRIRNAINQVF